MIVRADDLRGMTQRQPLTAEAVHQKTAAVEFGRPGSAEHIGRVEMGKRVQRDHFTGLQPGEQAAAYQKQHGNRCRRKMHEESSSHDADHPFVVSATV